MRCRRDRCAGGESARAFDTGNAATGAVATTRPDQCTAAGGKRRAGCPFIAQRFRFATQGGYSGSRGPAFPRVASASEAAGTARLRWPGT